MAAHELRPAFGFGLTQEETGCPPGEAEAGGGPVFLGFECPLRGFAQGLSMLQLLGRSPTRLRVKAGHLGSKGGGAEGF